MKKIKAILSDFDGTLVDKNEQYQPGVQTLIKKFKVKTSNFHWRPVELITVHL